MAANKTPTAAVLEYLLAQNRPYSANDIVLNLHNAHGKTAVQKALDLLVADAKIVEKLNGKQKAYVIRQDELPSASESELAELDAAIRTKEDDLRQAQEALKKAEAAQKAVANALTTEEAEEEAGRIGAEVTALEARLARLREQGEVELVSKEEKEEIARSREAAIKEWRRRKRMCAGVIDAILENYPKSKQVLFEEVGIETDEEMGVKMPDD